MPDDHLILFAASASNSSPSSSSGFALVYVRPDLMRASRLQFALDERDVAEALDHLPARHGVFALFALGEHELPDSVLHGTADVPFDGSLILIEITPYQCVVAAVRGAIEELTG